MKILFIVLILASCGKRKENDCRSSEEMILECQASNTPNYGWNYSREMCNRQYKYKRCW
jgi:hypothetical protein